jgi:hypothetical protein
MVMPALNKGPLTQQKRSFEVVKDPIYPPGTRIRVRERCRPYYGNEYQNELTIRTTELDDYGRRYYTFEEYPYPSKVYLYEFQVEHEFETVVSKL